MIHIEIERQSDDQLRRQVWVFWYYDNRHSLVLDSYRMESRQSKRQKFRVDAIYNRLQHRDSTVDEVAAPMPAEVVKEAMDKFNASLRVCKWAEVR